MATNGSSVPAPKSSRARQFVMPSLARASRYETLEDNVQVQVQQGRSMYSKPTTAAAAAAAGARRSSLRTPTRAGVYGAGGQRRRDAPAQAHRRAVSTLTRELRSAPDADAGAGGGGGGGSFEGDENEERGNWSGRLDFLLSCLGYAVGLGNVWRFPYMCFSNGGGAFLLPYTLFLLLCGIPVFLLDLSLGQFTSEGPATCWEFAPIFNGVGYAMGFLSSCVAIYYNMIIAYSIYYLFASMANPLPWSGCHNPWNTQYCRDRLPVVACPPAGRQANGTCYNGTRLLGLYNETLFTVVTKKSRVLPADEYYNHEVLKASGSIDVMGGPDWKLVLCLLASWVIVFLCMIRGIKSSGKVVYFTALFPYAVLLILFFRGVTLKDAGRGVYFYIVPDFRRLADAEVWKDAAGQIFFSLSASWGGLMSLASYNRFHNNVLRDTFIVCFANCATSIFAGFVIFSFIGHLAGSLGVDVKDVSDSGFGLAFIIYPEAVNLLPGSTFWAILFFFMLLTLGLDSQFAMVETVITSVTDRFPFFRPRKTLLIAALSLAMFLLGLPYTCPGGSYLMTIVDSYSGSWTILLIGFFECIAIGWVYGRPWFGSFHRFSEDIAVIVQKPIWRIWRYLWQFVSPALILAIIVFNWVKYKRTQYSENNLYPVWADALGWLIAITSVLIIVGTGLYKLLKESSDTSWSQRLQNVSIPTYKWGPALPKHRMLMAPYLAAIGALEHFYLDPRRLIKYTEVFGSEQKLPTEQSASAPRNFDSHSNPAFADDAANQQSVA